MGTARSRNGGCDGPAQPAASVRPRRGNRDLRLRAVGVCIAVALAVTGCAEWRNHGAAGGDAAAAAGQTDGASRQRLVSRGHYQVADQVAAAAAGRSNGATIGQTTAPVGEGDLLPSEGAGEATGAPPAPFIDKGTGVFVASPRPSAEPVRVTEDGNISMRFVDADVHAVIKSVFTEILELNYAIDPRVQGMVTVETKRPVPRALVLPILETVLRLNRIAIIERDGFYEVVPLDDALQAGASIAVGPGTAGAAPGYSLQIVPLKHIGAQQMQRILTPIAPKGSVVSIDAERNFIVLAGTGQQLRSLVRAVEIFDVDWLEGMSFALFPLEFAEAKVLVKELDEVFGTDAKGPLAGLVRFVPVERLNAILAVTSRPRHLDEIKSWIDQLDRGRDTIGPKLYVYYVQNGRAVDLAETLIQIFAPTGAEAAPPLLGDVAPGREAVTLVAPAAQPVPAGTPAGAAGATGAAGAAAPALPTPAPRTVAGARSTRQAASAGQAAASPASNQIRVIADDTKNALVILATPADFRMVEATLRKLDIMPLQVLIEATIAEITLNDTLQYGLQWFFSHDNALTKTAEFTFSSLASGAVSAAFPGFSALFETGGQARMVLTALSDISDVKIISSPQLLVLSNQTASLQVGDQVPIVVQSQSSVEGTAVTNTVQFRDTGVTLTVTPRVNAGGLVIMDIEQDVSEAVATTTSGIDSPTIQQRRVSSTVALKSGETVALGGLIRENQTEGRSGIPILSDIPILGLLFSTTTDSTRRTELLILLTPRVIEDPEQAREITEELSRRMRSLAPVIGP